MTAEISLHIVVVIPAYCVEKHIESVIGQIPPYVQTIIAVDDCSPDNTGALLDRLARSNERLIVIHHEKNQGVGGATKSGYHMALEKNADIVVKLDGDGQMDSTYIEELVQPVASGQVGYTKGNRFQDWGYVQKMPLMRKMGNLGLSFLIKLASGYWNLFDPTNGFTAISAQTLQLLDFERLKPRYLFESSMLANLYLHNVPVMQVAMPAIYRDERSSLNLFKSLVEFPLYLLSMMVRRFMHCYVWQNFTAVSLFVALGLFSMGFGVVFGSYHWIQSIRFGLPATAGTVMLSALPTIMGFQLLLEAIVLDIGNVPMAKVPESPRK